MKLLIVDDNKDMRKLLRNLFENKADKIIECPDGWCAVEQYDRHLPDYVLMDIEMAGIDGFEATKRILKKHPWARVVIITSYANTAYEKIALRIGAKAFVSKDNLFELENIFD